MAKITRRGIVPIYCCTHLFVSLLRVESKALARLCTTGTAGTLLSRGTADGRDEQGLNSNARVVHLLLGEPGVDDEHDAVDRERRLGNVGRADNLPPDPAVGLVGRRRLEDPLLQVGRERRVERDALDLAGVRAEVVHLALDALARLLDLLLAGEEEEDVTLDLFADVDLDDGPDGGFHVVLLGLGCVEDFDRVRPTGDGHKRRVIEVRLR